MAPVIPAARALARISNGDRLSPGTDPSSPPNHSASTVRLGYESSASGVPEGQGTAKPSRPRTATGVVAG